MEFVFVFFWNCSPNVIRITKSRNVRWVGQVTRRGEKRNAYRIFGGNAIRLLRRLSEKILLKCIVEK
jgi:hypothetical protein